jgi:pimeloyl-ACP methyl ester carboxylesterase
MFNPSLPHLLEGTANNPSLIVWGRDDRIVPISASQVYQKSMKNARTFVLDGCGHRPEVEKSQQFIEQVRNFLG